MFDPDLIARYSRNNALGVSLLAVGFLIERGQSVEDWAVWLGSRFAGPGTNWKPGMGAARMAHEAALEMVSLNARLVDISAEDDVAVVRLEWPTTDDLVDVGLRRQDIQGFWLVWQPIASSVGLQFECSTDAAGITTLRFLVETTEG